MAVIYEQDTLKIHGFLILQCHGAGGSCENPIHHRGGGCREKHRIKAPKVKKHGDKSQFRVHALSVDQNLVNRGRSEHRRD